VKNRKNNIFKKLKLKLIIAVGIMCISTVIFHIAYVVLAYHYRFILFSFVSVLILTSLAIFYPIYKLLTKQLHIQNSYARELESHIAMTETLLAQSDLAINAKNDFLSNISHEIRTPLNGIIGMTELLMDTNLDNTQKQYLKVLKNSGGSLLSMIDDIFDYSKIESGVIKITETTFNFRYLLEEFIRSYIYRAEEKGLKLYYEIDNDIPEFISSDPERIKQILANLISNAIKFTEKGYIKLVFNLESDSAFYSYVRFSITDTGMGIGNSDPEKLFEKFSQGDNSTTREFGGIGLGLAISKHLANLMGGEIGVKTPEGGGSCFWFTLKLKKGEKDINPVEFGDVSRSKILCIGDNHTNREVLGAMLGTWGVKHKILPNVSDAINIIKNSYDSGEPYNVVIIDKQMNNDSDHFLCKIISSDNRFKNTRIILLTTVLGDNDLKSIEELGYDAYLTKPILQIDLFDCIAQVLGERDSSLKKKIITKNSLHESRNFFN